MLEGKDRVDEEGSQLNREEERGNERKRGTIKKEVNRDRGRNINEEKCR